MIRSLDDADSGGHGTGFGMEDDRRVEEEDDILTCDFLATEDEDEGMEALMFVPTGLYSTSTAFK